jgi:hypothetical protein
VTSTLEFTSLLNAYTTIDLDAVLRASGDVLTGVSDFGTASKLQQGTD